MNKREEFEKALQDYDACNICIASNKDWNEKRNKLRSLFPAVQPSPELPDPEVSFTIGGYVEPKVTTGKVAFTAAQMLAYGAQCRAAAIPMSPEQQRILDFLYGTGEIDGKAFGECGQNEGMFWWRKQLRAAFPTTSVAPPLSAAPKRMQAFRTKLPEPRP